MIPFSPIKAFGKWLWSHRLIIATLLIFIALRTGMVLFDLWTTAEQGDIPESMSSGNLAFDLLNGTWRNWHVYESRVKAHVGLYPVTSLLALPLFALFGDSLFTFSLLPTVASSGTILLLYMLGRRYFSQKVGITAALLFLGAPYEVHGWDMYPSYPHLFISFLSLMAVWCTLQIADITSKPKQRLACFAFGVFCGLAIYYTDAFLFVLLGIATLLIVYYRPLFRDKACLLFLAGLSLGLLPYLFFTTPLNCLRLYLSGCFTYSYEAWQRVCDPWLTLANTSILFWPLGLGLQAKAPIPGRLIIVLIGFGFVFSLDYRRLPEKTKKAVLPMVVYIASYLTALLIERGPNQIYIFPIFGATTFIISLQLVIIYEAWRHKWPFLNKLAPIALVIVCLYNPLKIACRFRPAEISTAWKKQTTARGHSLFYPHPYKDEGGYVPFSGYKTDLTIKVEDYAHRHPFEELPFFQPPAKTIYISPSRRAGISLSQPEAYYLFGIDVTAQGLIAMSERINAEVPPADREYAFAGLAVFFCNDFLFNDVVNAFESGTVDRSIPSQYLPAFYRELGRRLRDRDQKLPDWLANWKQKPSPDQKQWLSEGFQNSRYMGNYI